MKTVGWLLGLALIGHSTGWGGTTAPAYAGQPGTLQTVGTALVAQARPTPEGTPAAQVSERPDAQPLPPMAYKSKGRRDPFRPLQAPVPPKKVKLQLYSMKLVGILQGREGPMAVVEGPEGLGYIVKTGDAIAEGRVAKIGTESMTVRVVKRPGAPPTPYVMRLTKE